MESKDFRIDNLVYGPDKKTVCRIKYIDGEENTISTDLFSERHSEEYTFILLTEEWQPRFDYINTIENYWSNGILEIRFDNDDKHFYYEYLTSSGRTEILALQYVHQLQNLFFALTGKELTLKEN